MKYYLQVVKCSSVSSLLLNNYLLLDLNNKYMHRLFSASYFSAVSIRKEKKMYRQFDTIRLVGIPLNIYPCIQNSHDFIFSHLHVFVSSGDPYMWI